MKTLTISAKCSDLFSARLSSDLFPGSPKNYDGYVPDWFPNPNAGHYGDYVQLTIDVDTGHILNWKKPTEAQLKETFRGARQMEFTD